MSRLRCWLSSTRPPEDPRDLEMEKPKNEETAMDKAIITVVGKDTVGIIAKTTAYLAKNDLNILDISQTVVGGYFNMMMIVDITKCRKTFDKLGTEMAKLGVEMGLRIRCQKSEIFEKMHRV